MRGIKNWIDFETRRRDILIQMYLSQEDTVLAYMICTSYHGIYILWPINYIFFPWRLDMNTWIAKPVVSNIYAAGVNSPHSVKILEQKVYERDEENWKDWLVLFSNLIMNINSPIGCQFMNILWIPISNSLSYSISNSQFPKSKGCMSSKTHRWKLICEESNGGNFSSYIMNIKEEETEKTYW